MNGNSYLTRKIHSLLGVIPLGLFLVEHAITNYSAFEDGPEGFNDSVGFLNGLPLVLFLEIFGIFLPLLFHGVYGLYVAYQSNWNNSRFKYGRNWAFTAQRVTGVITFIFVIWHVFETRFQVALGNLTHEELGARMHEIFTNPVYIVLYAIGVLSAVFHFANGMWSFLVSWGITVGPRAQRVSAYIWMGVFVIVSALFLLSIVAFTGSDFAESASAVRTWIG
ncbi:succinate dehydrogenase cytochrome b558 subunit [Paenibacillus sp. D51F]|uniref:succinate dehydrogenase cytochrome b558 subunit n=1 Tax=unclassified Paenibacillus TaxID=185978 RepID=UPI0009542B7F|nr:MULTISPECIES: succinate dehydrogenase cytochrome b558 subunit [unclassified Paenibacillus]ASS66647.1 succinate dehydrogenase [Paenibacillus sp. RUD330]SIP99821.1 succinate dehydrogenase subunit C [Paenibacillus sp. RU4X]SIQ18961.1 succinate dehydrogenase subunit C [Paenibacillus sp. RU4T]